MSCGQSRLLIARRRSTRPSAAWPPLTAPSPRWSRNPLLGDSIRVIDTYGGDTQVIEVGAPHRPQQRYIATLENPRNDPGGSSAVRTFERDVLQCPGCHNAIVTVTNRWRTGRRDVEAATVDHIVAVVLPAAGDGITTLGSAACAN